MHAPSRPAAQPLRAEDPPATASPALPRHPARLPSKFEPLVGGAGSVLHCLARPGIMVHLTALSCFAVLICIFSLVWVGGIPHCSPGALCSAGLMDRDSVGDSSQARKVLLSHLTFLLGLQER